MLDILVVDDDPTILMSVSVALRAGGHRVALAHDGAVAQGLLNRQVFDLLICELCLPRVDGMMLFRQVRRGTPTTDIIVLTAFGAASDAAEALRDGAKDCLTKPFKLEVLVARVAQIAHDRAQADRHGLVQPSLGGQPPTHDASGQGAIVGQSSVLKRALERAITFAQSAYPVLISGESGTGKELIAKLLHEHSTRRAAPLVAVGCAAFPETLIEAELFGYKRGAFTGAFQDRDGRFKAAHNGTLFLDEVAEIPLPTQAKLLRVLQEGCYEPLGTNQSIRVDVRIISATHRDLRERVRLGLFREDLYYRLKVLGVDVPPLRARRGDIPILVAYFLRRFPRADGQTPEVSARAMAALTTHSFPGNVRELEHAMQHAGVLAQGADIDVVHLPPEISGEALTRCDVIDEREVMQPLPEALQRFEREYLLRALHLAGGKRTRAAAMLGISRKNLWQKLRRHSLLDVGAQTQDPGGDGDGDENEAK